MKHKKVFFIEQGNCLVYLNKELRMDKGEITAYCPICLKDIKNPHSVCYECNEDYSMINGGTNG